MRPIIVFERSGDSLLRLQSAVVNIHYSTLFALPEASEEFHLRKAPEEMK